MKQIDPWHGPKVLPNQPPQPTPPVHVNRDQRTAKFWLEPVTVAIDGGFPQNELNKIDALVRSHQAEVLKAWHDFFGSGSGNR